MPHSRHQLQRGGRWRSPVRRAVIASLVVATILAGGTTILQRPTPATAQAPTGYSFVADGARNSVTEYALGANGNASPVATISGPSTGLSSPVGVAVDPSGTLFVANNANSSVTEYAPGASGNAAPIASISGALTQLSAPAGVALDTTGNVFVTNANTNSVTQYPKGASGDAAPTTVIMGGSTGLAGPTSLALDGSGTIFVINNSTNAVTEYAKGSSGNQPPTATIAGPNTHINDPFGIALDASGTVFVTSAGGFSISVLEFAKEASGDASPTTIISGSKTGLASPFGVAVDASGNTFVTNDNPTPSVTEYAKGASGNAAPTATIAGSNTGLDAPRGVAVTPRKMAPPVASSQQFGVPNQTDVFTVDSTGALDVFWVQGSGAWNGPLAISAPGSLSPGAHLAVSQQFGISNQTDVFAVNPAGALEVFFVQGAGRWNGPLAITAPSAVPAGGPLAATNQFGIPNQTDVLSTAQDGSVQVSWVQGGGIWRGPLAISPVGLVSPGAQLAASPQFGVPNQTDVFSVAKTGASQVLWVQGGGTWHGPLALSRNGAAPSGASVAATRQFGLPNQTDLFDVATNSSAQVSWVEGAGGWNGPLQIFGRAAAAPPGAPLAASNQFGLSNQTDVFTVSPGRVLQVSWVQGAGNWLGPLAIGPPGSAPAGAPLAATNQFGVPNQTDVFTVSPQGIVQVSWVQGSGAWHGPMPI